MAWFDGMAASLIFSDAMFASAAYSIARIVPVRIVPSRQARIRDGAYNAPPPHPPSPKA
jgi:hypothetical protein